MRVKKSLSKIITLLHLLSGYLGMEKVVKSQVGPHIFSNSHEKWQFMSKDKQIFYKQFDYLQSAVPE